MAAMGDECRERGLRRIAEIRSMLAAVPRRPNPFRHSHDDDCEACGGPCVVPGLPRSA